MSKRGQTLRALVTERLTAAAEEIFALVERTIAEYEEELCRSKEENQRKQQLLDEALSPQPPLVHTQSTDVQIQTESEALAFKQEERIPAISCVTVKSEDSDSDEEEICEILTPSPQTEALTEVCRPGPTLQQNAITAPQDITSAPQDITSAPQDITSAPQDITSAPQDITSASRDTTPADPQTTAAAAPQTADQTTAVDMSIRDTAPQSLDLPNRDAADIAANPPVGKRKRGRPRRLTTPADNDEKSLQLSKRSKEKPEGTAGTGRRGAGTGRNASQAPPTSSTQETKAEIKAATRRQKDSPRTPAQNFQIQTEKQDEAGPSSDQVDRLQSDFTEREERLQEFAAACMMSTEQSERREDTDCEDWSYDWTGQPGSSRQLFDTDEEPEDYNPAAENDNPFVEFTGKKASVKSDMEGKVKHECPVCRKKLGRKQELKRHMLLHTGEKPFSCPVCDKRFIQKSNLKSHIVTHLDSVDTIIRFQKPIEPNRGDTEEDWGGTGEDLGLEPRDKLMDNLSDSDNDEDWAQMMEEPGESSSSQRAEAGDDDPDGSSLERISLLLHQALNESKARGKTTEFQCPMCDKVFGRMENLRRHLLVHTGEKAFSCPVCNKQFTLKQHLKLHMVLHTRDQQFACSVCSKTFIRKDNLRSHMRIHSTDRPFGCPECGARFYTDQDLARHTAHHTGERKFVCPVCNSGFLSRRYLNRHIKIHKKEAEKSTE